MPENKHPIAISILILSSLIILFNISAGEVQPWDEGLYAYRARVIIQNNSFIDQTPWAIGGLYSSSYPPLIPIAISFAIKLFGNSTFSIRFFSTLCSILTLVCFFYYFTRRYPIPLVFLFTANLLISFHWLFYSRQGMTDIPLVCFIFLTIIFAQHTIEKLEEKNRFIYGILTTIIFSFALMTKVVVSLIPLIFLVALIIKKEKKKFFSVAPFFLSGIFLALPWYLFMTFHYGTEFASVLIPMHLFVPVENHIQKLSFLYYVNQIIVSNPIFILGLINLVLLIANPSNLQRYHIFELTMILWSAFGLIFFSFAVTQLQHYTVYLLLPINFLAMDYVHREKTFGIKIISTTLILLFLASLWYFTGDFRKYLSQNLSLPIIILSLSLLLILVLFLVLSFSNKVANYLTKISLENVVLFLNILILIITIISLQTQPVGKIFGGEAISKILLELKDEKLVYIYHYYNESDKFNPQISWYTNGKFLSGNEGDSTLRFPLPRKKGIIAKLRMFKDLGKYNVLYYIADKKLPYQIVINELASTRKIIAITPNYILFGKTTKKIKEQNIIIVNQNYKILSSYSLI